MFKKKYIYCIASPLSAIVDHGNLFRKCFISPLADNQFNYFKGQSQSLDNGGFKYAKTCLWFLFLHSIQSVCVGGHLQNCWKGALTLKPLFIQVWNAVIITAMVDNNLIQHTHMGQPHSVDFLRWISQISTLDGSDDVNA